MSVLNWFRPSPAPVEQAIHLSADDKEGIAAAERGFALAQVEEALQALANAEELGTEAAAERLHTASITRDYGVTQAANLRKQADAVLTSTRTEALSYEEDAAQAQIQANADADAARALARLLS